MSFNTFDQCSSSAIFLNIKFQCSKGVFEKPKLHIIMFRPECLQLQNVGRVVLKLFITSKMRILLLHRVEKMSLVRVPHPFF